MATRSGAIPELIKNKKNGYLVKYGDIKSFSNHILPAINLKKNFFFKKQHSNTLNFFSLNELFFKTDSVYGKFL